MSLLKCETCSRICRVCIKRKRIWCLSCSCCNSSGYRENTTHKNKWPPLSYVEEITQITLLKWLFTNLFQSDNYTLKLIKKMTNFGIGILFPSFFLKSENQIPTTAAPHPPPRTPSPFIFFEVVARKTKTSPSILFPHYISLLFSKCKPLPSNSSSMAPM